MTQRMATQEGAAALLMLCVMGMMACGACRTSTPQPDDEGSRPEAAAQPAPTVSPDQLEALIARVEALRDRRFVHRPTLDPVPAARLEPDPAPLEGAAALERRALGRFLFGEPAEAKAPLRWPRPARARLARRDPAGRTITYAAACEDAQALEGAVLAALVDALNRQHFGAPEPPPGLDARIAAEAVRRGDEAFVVALDRLRRAHPDQEIPASLLARRPELAWRQPGHLRGLHGEGDEPGLGHAARRYAQREGLGLVAALVRGHGWSGVEVAAQQPPSHSGVVVGPARWMGGEGPGQLRWPDAIAEGWAARDWVEQHRAPVGPALVAAWLEQTQAAPAQAIRAVPAAWRAGQWRLWRRGDQQRFVWVTQWEAPTAAGAVAEMCSAALRAAHGGQDDHEGGALRHAVVHDGLNVAVVVTSQPELELEPVATAAAGAHVTFGARQGVPLEYVPSDAERLVRGAAQMTLHGVQPGARAGGADEAGVEGDEPLAWEDPALGLRADLSALEGWDVQLDRQGLIRWWARRDGVLVQLTAELDDPLGPSFGTEPYTAQLEQALTTSLHQAEVVARQRAEDHPVGPLLGLRVEGQLQTQPRVIQLWHMRRGRARVTLSVNAPRGAQTSPELARLLLEGLAPLDTDAEGGAHAAKEPAARGQGVLEFRVED